MTATAQTLRNLIGNGMNFLALGLFGLFFTPFLEDAFGIESYGIIQIAVVIGSYVALLINGYLVSANRYYTIAFNENDPKKERNVLNTCFFFSMFIILCLIVPLYFFSRHVGSFINIPQAIASDTGYLFFFAILGYSIAMMAMILGIPAYARNRMDVVRSISIVYYLGFLVLSICTVKYFYKNVAMIGFSSFAAAALGITLGLLILKKFAKGTPLSPRYVRGGILKEISIFSAGVFFIRLGDILLLEIDVILLNLWIDPTASGQFAALAQWTLLFRQIARVFAPVLTPVMLGFYTEGDHPKLFAALTSLIKSSGLALAVPVGIISVFSDKILLLWLGPEFALLAPFLVAMLFHQALNLAMLPLYEVATIYGKIWLLSAINLLFGFLHIILVYCGIRYFGLGMWSPILCVFLLLTVKSFLVLPLYISRISGIPKADIYRPVLPSVALTVVIVAAGALSRVFVHEFSWLTLCGLSLLLVALAALIVWTLFLPQTLKSELRGAAWAFIKKLGREKEDG
jgi:O-antigen/teichoic acid export membrane protein